MPMFFEPDDRGPYPHPGSYSHPAAGYDFHERTVSRHLVHRAAVSEVLITGWQSTGPYDFLVGAQWPRQHGSHRLPGVRHHDPLLLAETVRQAGLLIGHVGFGVPRGHQFALDELCYALGPDGVDGLAATAAPACLMLEIGCHDVRMRNGRLASLRVQAEIRRDGRPVGRAAGQLRVYSPVAYARLRGDARHAPAGPGQHGASWGPEPAVLDRGADAVLAPSPVPGSWLLRADAGHPVLFDQAADHVPGMLVLEAARQAAQRLYREPVVPVELVSSFNSLIERDRPCLVRAVPESGTVPPARGGNGYEDGHGYANGRGRVPVRVVLVQDDRTVAECRVLTEPAGDAPARSRADGRPGRTPGLPLAS
ncbi:ScbA/BarX family gamma-butyrolactone biosynthesis protein [Kitasatospora sp. NPDC047058]|uniref:ScbA/BarX family gamma-butyrolactone biosynthesis protein n=1 Tax=Kitasatospora sp. NPDC047058 TaxID=3155620 RepID=UPI0033D934E0